jgi:L-ascorbate metabolism protein UlaG (beta-lactamase superfamily)
MMLIPAYRKDMALLKEIDDAVRDPNQFDIWWLGQSGYLLHWNGKRILIDPYLSDSLTQKYAATDKPHVRMSEQVISPKLLTSISIISSSHNHTDHLDAATLKPLLRNNPGVQLIIPEANRQFVAERIDCMPGFPTGLSDRQSFAHAGFTFHGMPAKHNEVERDAHGHCRYMGYVITFGPFAVYHSGDTLWMDELPALLQPFHLDLALLPINGNKPERRVAGNLDAAEAAALAKAAGAACVIPCHYDMFAFNTADPKDFEKACDALLQPYKVLRHGESYSHKQSSD